MRDALYRKRRIEPAPAHYGGSRINDFILVSEAFSNCYLLQTSQGDIQVNAGMGLEAPVIRQNFDEFTADPLRYLILTQGHVDHVGGTAYLRKLHPGLQVIAQAGNPEHQAGDARLSTFRANRSAFAFADKFDSALKHYADHDYTDFPAQDAPTPDILFERNYNFSLGALDVELIAVPGAETNDSLIVWLPQHRICLTGNLFGCPFGHFPNLVTIRGDRYRDALTVASAVQTVMELEPELILYGHHEPVAGAQLIRSELEVLHDAIIFVHDATVKGMNEGKDLYALMNDIELPPELEVGQGYGKVSWGVRAIWENYAGWFKHRSTAELFGQPADGINADLLKLAGGPDAIVALSEEKIAAANYVEAIQLLDIVLSMANPPLRALEAAISAHDKLLQRSENFWLSSWLRKQIASYQSRL